MTENTPVPLAPEEPRPVEVSIWGSCISRDVFNTKFNVGYKAMWHCELMQNQSSLISTMSPAFPIPEELLGDEQTDYQKQQVRNDTSDVFLERLVELQPEYLVVDFFGDIHMGVLEVGPCQYVTNNRWMLAHTRWYAERKAAGELRPLGIETDTEAYLALWKDALQRFAAYVAEHLPNTTVVVHRGRNAERWLAEEQARPRELTTRKKLFKIDVDRANELWRQLDDLACAVPGWLSIDLTDREYLSFKGHPWGVFYVHYTLDYYDEFLAALNGIHLTRFVGEHPIEAAMLEHNAAARAARHAELGSLVAQVRSQQDRIRRLRGELDAAQAAAEKRGLMARLRRR